MSGGFTPGHHIYTKLYIYNTVCLYGLRFFKSLVRMIIMQSLLQLHMPRYFKTQSMVDTSSASYLPKKHLQCKLENDRPVCCVASEVALTRETENDERDGAAARWRRSPRGLAATEARTRSHDDLCLPWIHRQLLRLQSAPPPQHLEIRPDRLCWKGDGPKEAIQDRLRSSSDHACRYGLFLCFCGDPGSTSFEREASGGGALYRWHQFGLLELRDRILQL